MAVENEWRNGGIINPLFDGLTYNTSGHFAHCSYFSSPRSTTKLAKYPRVLYVKPSNKVYVLHVKQPRPQDAFPFKCGKDKGLGDEVSR